MRITYTSWYDCNIAIAIAYSEGLEVKKPKNNLGFMKSLPKVEQSKGLVIKKNLLKFKHHFYINV